MPPKTEKSSWTTEEQLDYVVRLLLRYNKSPSARAVPPPPDRTIYAAEHLLRKLRAKYGCNNDSDEAEDSGVAKPPEKKHTPKPKTPKRKVTASGEEYTNEQNTSKPKKAKKDVIMDEAEV